MALKNKAVLISIQPEWCKKIITKEKTVEIRKTMPSVISEPFKCYSIAQMVRLFSTGKPQTVFVSI